MGCPTLHVYLLSLGFLFWSAGQCLSIDWYTYARTDQPWYNEQTSNTPGSRVRLVGGNYYSGRVEVYFGGQWGTICDDRFDHNDAMVICKMLGLYQGYGYVVAYGSAYYGQGNGPILYNLNCHGYESDFSYCPSYGWYTNNCLHGEDAGVNCYEYYEQTTDIPRTTYPWWIQPTSDWGVSVRLVNGPNSHSGRVEIRHNGVWGTVCDDEFDHHDVLVICRMLGMYYGENYGLAYSNAHYGSGAGPIQLDNLRCYGHESDISQCMSNSWGNNDCDHSEDAGLDCYAYSPDLTTENPSWLQQSSFSQDGRVRLVNGNYHSGRVEVYSGGQWGTICDDSFNHNDAKVICRMLGLYNGENYGVAYQAAYYGRGTGPIIIDDLRCYGYETNIRDCQSTPWFQNNCDHGEDAGVDCYAYNYDITTTYPWWLTTRYYYTTYSTSFPWWRTTYNPWWTHYTTYGLTLDEVIHVNCNQNGWDIRVDMYKLREMYPNSKASDIYLGENTCTGSEDWRYLTFRQGLRECLTSETIGRDALVYHNELVYAERDPRYQFIIRNYNWTVAVECDVQRNETSSGHLHHDNHHSQEPQISGSSHFTVNMSFYSDPNFLNRISGNPLQVSVGEKVYVKVYTTTPDWSVKMRVHTCYAKPSQYSSDNMKFFLIRNGCEVDANTHLISQSAHETRFIFQDFEYTSNHEGIHVFCDAEFCGSHDYSQQCQQTCNPVIRRRVHVVKPTEESTTVTNSDDTTIETNSDETTII